MNKKIIVISGASRGIGKACAESLANENVILILIGRNQESLTCVSQNCIKKGAEVKELYLDLVNLNSMKSKIEDIVKTYNNIDILINNAGIWLEESFEKGDMDKWDNALDVNLKSSIHLTRYCLEGMTEGSSIIFIASTASKKVYYGGTNYCAAKFGLLGFAGSLFEDIREKGIKVSSILPGVVNTDMHKGDDSLIEEKMIQPEDVAQTVNFVISMPNNVCPTEITLQPQKNPKIRK